MASLVGILCSSHANTSKAQKTDNRTRSWLVYLLRLTFWLDTATAIVSDANYVSELSQSERTRASNFRMSLKIAIFGYEPTFVDYCAN